MGKGSYGRAVRAPEVGVTLNNFDIYDGEIVERSSKTNLLLKTPLNV